MIRYDIDIFIPIVNCFFNGPIPFISLFWKILSEILHLLFLFTFLHVLSKFENLFFCDKWIIFQGNSFLKRFLKNLPCWSFPTCVQGHINPVQYRVITPCSSLFCSQAWFSLLVLAYRATVVLLSCCTLHRPRIGE